MGNFQTLWKIESMKEVLVVIPVIVVLHLQPAVSPCCISTSSLCNKPVRGSLTNNSSAGVQMSRCSHQFNHDGDPAQLITNLAEALARQLGRRDNDLAFPPAETLPRFVIKKNLNNNNSSSRVPNPLS